MHSPGRESDRDNLSARSLAELAAQLYAGVPFLQQAMYRLRPYICPLDRILPHVPQGSTVLDIGCGGGLFLSLLSRLDPQVRGVGVDCSSAAIAIAARLARQRIAFECCREPQEWPHGPFDVVSLIDVLHHVPPAQQSELFTAAAQRVAAKGRLIYKDMGSTPLWRAAANRLHDLLVAKQWIHYVPLSTVLGWASQYGLRTLAIQRIPRLWYEHDLAVFERS